MFGTFRFKLREEILYIILLFLPTVSTYINASSCPSFLFNLYHNHVMTLCYFPSRSIHRFLSPTCINKNHHVLLFLIYFPTQSLCRFLFPTRINKKSLLSSVFDLNIYIEHVMTSCYFPSQSLCWFLPPTCINKHHHDLLFLI